MTRTPSPLAHAHTGLSIDDLDGIVGGGQAAPVSRQAQAGKAGQTPNLLVVIAIIAILIG